MTHINRVVIGLNEEKKSAVILRDTPNYQEVPGMVWRSTLWATTELPVDNQIPGDRSLGVVIREPAENGLMFHVLELPPDPKNPQKHLAFVQEMNEKLKQKYQPTEEDQARHPTMHRTETCDFGIIVSGEVYLVTETDETLLKVGDTVIVKGVNHAWSNRSDKPCLMMGVMVHAHPGDWWRIQKLRWNQWGRLLKLRSFWQFATSIILVNDLKDRTKMLFFPS